MGAEELRKGQVGTTKLNKRLPTTGTPVNGVAAQGTLTIAEPVTADDTMTLGTDVYTFKAGATAAAFEIGIGASEAATKLAIVAAINGTDSQNTARTDMTAAAFSGDDCVLTAVVKGTGANSIATTETFTHASNVFDAGTLGTTTAGVDGTVGEGGECKIDSSYLYYCVADSFTTNHTNWRRVSLGSAY